MRWFAANSHHSRKNGVATSHSSSRIWAHVLAAGRAARTEAAYSQSEAVLTGAGPQGQLWRVAVQDLDAELRKTPFGCPMVKGSVSPLQGWFCLVVC